MAAGQGHAAWGSLVEETTFGTTPGTGEVYFEIISESLKQEIEVKTRKSLRGVSPRKTLMANKVVGGDIVMDMLYEGLGKFIKHGMGGYSFAANTPVASANTHTFTLADTLPIGLSIEINKGNIPSGDVFLYQGCKVNTLEFLFQPEEIMQLTAGIIAQTETADGAASGTPTYPTDLPVKWHHSGTLTLAGAGTLDFESLKILVENNLRRRFLMYNTTRQLDREGRRMVTGEAVVEFEDLTHYNKYVGGTTGVLQLICTSDVLVVGSTYHSMTITMPKIQLTGASPVVEGEGPIRVTYPFMGLHDGSTTDALTITIVNDETTLA